MATPAPTLTTLIFDVDGTLADTEEAHREAFNRAFAELGLDWHWDVPLYTRLLEISGGKERIAHYWNSQDPRITSLVGQALQDTIARIHDLKTAHYEAQVQEGAVTLRPGVLALLDEAASASLQLAIATTTSPVNIAALLRRAMGPDWRQAFVAIGDASTAPVKKPHPMVYQQILQTLQVPATACLAFEDSGNGLLAATRAGIATVVTPTAYTRGHDFRAALREVPDLGAVCLADLRRWFAQGAMPQNSIS